MRTESASGQPESPFNNPGRYPACPFAGICDLTDLQVLAGYGARKPHIVKFVKKVQKSKSPKVPVVKPKRYDTCTRSQWLRKGWRMPPDVMTNHPASSKHATFCQGSDMLCASSTWGVTFRRGFFPEIFTSVKTVDPRDRKTDRPEN